MKCVSTSDLPAAVSFLDRDYCYQPVGTQNPQGSELAPNTSTGRRFLLHRDSNMRSIPYYKFKLTLFKQHDHGGGTTWTIAMLRLYTGSKSDFIDTKNFISLAIEQVALSTGTLRHIANIPHGQWCQEQNSIKYVSGSKHNLCLVKLQFQILRDKFRTWTGIRLFLFKSQFLISQGVNYKFFLPISIWFRTSG